MLMNVKPRIALVTGWDNPEGSSMLEICAKLLSILKPLSNSLTWIVTNLRREVSLGDNISLIKIESKYVARDASALKLIPYYLLHQCKVVFAILKLLPKVDMFIFAQGSDLSFLPILLVRLAGKKVILRSDGRWSVSAKKYLQRVSKIKIALLRIGETISYSLANKILPESKGMVDLFNLQSYANKISIGSQYVDTFTFTKTKKLSERVYDVGYIGRLIRVKGALEFIKSLPLILRDKRIKAIIIGDGDLRDEIKHMLIKNNIQDQVKLLGWVENKQIPLYLTDIKMVVVPSDYEGLSNLVLESMACGTPVLATPVGGIPDVIRDEETGFIMEDNSPECIAKNVIRVLGHPGLEQISENARALIEQEYTYEAAVERFRSVLESLNLKRNIISG